MEKRHLFALVVVFILLASLVSACSSPSTTSAASTTSAISTTQAPPQSEETFNWKLVGGYPAGSTIHKYGLPALKHYIETLSNGRINITLFSGGELYPVEEVYEATLEGVTEMTWTTGGYFRGKVPIAGCDDGQPMLWPNPESIVYTHQHLGLNEIKREAYEEAGIYFLGALCGNEHGLMSVEKLTDKSDFAGCTVRSYGAYLDWYANMGFKTVYIPQDEVYMALSLGTINAYSTGRGEEWTWRGHEVCDYYYMPGVGYQMGQIFLNMDAWNSLPDDLKQVLHASLDLLNLQQMTVWNPVWNEQATVWFDEYGLEAVTLPKDTVDFMYEEAEKVWFSQSQEAPGVKDVLDVIVNYLDHYRNGTLDELELERLNTIPLTGIDW